MSNITTKIAAVTLSGIALAGVSTTAQASTSTSDQKAMDKAAKVCADVSSEVQWEACTIGGFVLDRGKVVLADEYSVDGDRIILAADAPAHKPLPPTKVTKVTKADKKAMRAANLVCQETETEVEFENCAIGEFTLTRGRYVGGDMFNTDFGRSASRWVELDRHSLRIS